MHRVRRTIIAGCVVALGALDACRTTTAPQESDLAQARQRWAVNGIRSYEFTGALSCFCTTESMRAVTVSVTDGVVTRRVYADTGAPMAASNTTFSTGEALFELIGSAIARHAAVVDVTYDPVRGVPTRIAIDGSFQVADDEVYYGISDFRTR